MCQMEAGDPGDLVIQLRALKAGALTTLPPNRPKAFGFEFFLVKVKRKYLIPRIEEILSHSVPVNGLHCIK